MEETEDIYSYGYQRTTTNPWAWAMCWGLFIGSHPSISPIHHCLCSGPESGEVAPEFPYSMFPMSIALREANSPPLQSSPHIGSGSQGWLYLFLLKYFETLKIHKRNLPCQSMSSIASNKYGDVLFSFVIIKPYQMRDGHCLFKGNHSSCLAHGPLNYPPDLC